MMESSRVVSRVRKTEAMGPAKFSFPKEAVRLDGLSPYIQDYRKKAWEVYQSLELPTTKEEAWRRTDLRSLNPGDYQIHAQETDQNLPTVPVRFLESIIGEKHAGQVQLMAGGAKATLDEELKSKGVVFTDLRTAEREYPHLLEKIMGRIVKPEEGKFAALAASFAQTGVLVYVPRGVKVELPLHSLLWGAGERLAFLSHVMVYLEEGSSLTYVHEAASPAAMEGQLFHDGLVEIYVGPSANLRWVELQSWGENVWNFSHERARVEKDGTLEWVFGAVGSRLTKNFSTMDLAGEGATGRMSGFYFADHRQHLDHDTQQNHLAPHTTSDLMFKGALLGESHSVWQGDDLCGPGGGKNGWLPGEP